MTANDWIQLVLVFCRACGAGQAAGLVHGPRLRRQAVLRHGPRARLAGARHLSRCRRRSASKKWVGGKYTVAVLLFNAVGFLAVYALLRLQGVFAAQSARVCRPTRRTLAFNTAASFATNTNWQGYGGETTMSYLSQMLGLTVQNFVSAASGMAVLVALIRGLARRTAATIGNFWFDLVRSTLYILLPLSVVVALCLGFAGRHSELQIVRHGERAAADDRGRRHEARHAVACHGPGRIANRDQATRHERRRVLQCQLGASVRKSHAACELHRAAVHSVISAALVLHVRRDGRRHAARLGIAGRDVRDPGAADGFRRLAGAIGRAGVQRDGRRSSGHGRPVGRQHGRQRDALRHRQFRLCGRRPRPAHRTAASTRCTIRSRRWAAWCRCG